VAGLKEAPHKEGSKVIPLMGRMFLFWGTGFKEHRQVYPDPAGKRKGVKNPSGLGGTPPTKTAKRKTEPEKKDIVEWRYSGSSNSTKAEDAPGRT